MTSLPAYTYPCLAVKKKAWPFTMVTLYVEACELKRWCGVYRKSITQEGYQRTLQESHYGGIKKFLDADEARNVIPNSIVIAFNDQLLIENIRGPGATFNATSKFTPVTGTTNEPDEDTEILQGTLFVRVHPDCKTADLGQDDTKLEETLSDARSAYVIDGQHRIAGGNASSTKVYYPVTAFLGIKKEDQAFHYIVINSKAKKVSKHDIDAVIPKKIYEDLQERLAAAGIYTDVADVVWALDNDSDSPFLKQIQWANNNIKNAPFRKGGIDNLYARTRKLPQDILEKFESDVSLIKATWTGLKEAFKEVWDCGPIYKKAVGETFNNQFHIKSAAILPALQEAFNTAVSTDAIKTSDVFTLQQLTDRVSDYFSRVPPEFFYCEWLKKSITNDDMITSLATKIVTSCRTGKVPYKEKEWFSAAKSIESVKAQKLVEQEQKKKVRKPKKQKRIKKVKK